MNGGESFPSDVPLKNPTLNKYNTKYGGAKWEEKFLYYSFVDILFKLGTVGRRQSRHVGHVGTSTFFSMLCAAGERRIMETAGVYLNILRFLKLANPEIPRVTPSNPFSNSHSRIPRSSTIPMTLKN